LNETKGRNATQNLLLRFTRPMRAVCVVAAYILAGASAEISGCVLDPSAPNACRQGTPLADSTSLLQVKATERVQDESKAAALTQTAAGTQRCSNEGCTFGDWTEWGTCSKSCGIGTRTRTRDAPGPDSKCDVVCLKEVETCNVDPCTSTTVEPMDATKMCQFYGDPHFIAFDGEMEGGDTARLTNDPEGVLWVVKSDKVKIQIDASQKSLGSGTGTGWGRAIGLAVSGSTLGNHRLVFLKEGKKTLLDGQEIVKETGTPYTSDDKLIQVEHLEVLDPNEKEWKEQGYAEAEISDKIHGRETWIWRLPGKINIYFSLGDSICAIIKMPQVEDMDGLCGNFDDDRDNDLERMDGKNEISKRMKIAVGPGESIFTTDGSLLEEAEHRVVSGRTMKDCEPELKKQAEEKCAEIAEKTLREDCVYDICTDGNLPDEEDELQVEVLDTIARTDQKVNTAGQ